MVLRLTETQLGCGELSVDCVTTVYVGTVKQIPLIGQLGI
jgi:hypothetical protein